MLNISLAFNNGDSGYNIDYPLKETDASNSNWDTSEVTTMDTMFSYAEAFNQDISGFDTSDVENMDSMFYGDSVFNQDISGFNTSSVTYISYMFYNALAFDQDLSNWDVSSVTATDEYGDSAFSNMFYGAALSNENKCNIHTKFLSDNDYWSTPSYDDDDWSDLCTTTSTTSLTDTNIQEAVDLWISGGSDKESAEATYGHISEWDTSAVTDMSLLFKNGRDKADGSGTIDTTEFNEDISGWDTSAVTTMKSMFYDAEAFNNGGR